MSTRSQRGRMVQTRQKSSQTKIIYIILGVIVIAAIAVAAYMFMPKSSTAVATNVSLDSFPSKGDANAPVTVVEYGDFQCPSCGAFANYVEPSIDKDYIQTGKVRFIYHDFPLTQHLNAVPAAEAARCAADQGKFWDMYKLLFANQAQWSEISRTLPVFDSYAKEIGLDVATFDQCMNSEKYKPTILAAQQDAINAQIDATPTFVIDGQKYTAQNLRDGIEAALAKANQK
jgi:protein-disulfide isomerase